MQQILNCILILFGLKIISFEIVRYLNGISFFYIFMYLKLFQMNIKNFVNFDMWN